MVLSRRSWLALIWAQCSVCIRAQNYGPNDTCKQLFARANQAASSVGLSDTASLCTSGGAFWDAMSAVQNCGWMPTVKAIPDNIAASVFLLSINPALVLCNEDLYTSNSASCMSLRSQNKNCTVSISYFGQPTPGSGTFTPTAGSVVTQTVAGVPTTSAQTGAQSTTQQPSETASLASAADSNNRSNTGLIAGVAVGVSLGAIAMVVMLVLIWRYRRRARTKQKKQGSSLRIDTEKAQLHGESKDAYRIGEAELGIGQASERIELASPPLYARNIANLQELEGSSKSENRIDGRELASNEDVASTTITTKRSRSRCETPSER